MSAMHVQTSELAVNELHARLTETAAGNRRLMDMLAFEEACAHKLKRELGMSTLLHKSPMDRLSSTRVPVAPCHVSASDDQVENAYVQMYARLQTELRKRSELERRVLDAQNLTALLTEQRG